MVMLKSETSSPTWVPEGYRKLGWHAGFDVLIGPMYYKKDESGEFKFISKNSTYYWIHKFIGRN